jgi:hypothetical protein
MRKSTQFTFHIPHIAKQDDFNIKMFIQQRYYLGKIEVLVFFKLV